MTIDDTLRFNLKRLRLFKGLSQSELGKLVGVSTGMIRNTEQGITSLRWENVCLIADWMGVSVEEIRREVNPNEYLIGVNAPRERREGVKGE